MRKEIKFTHQEKRKLLMATLTVTLSISALLIGRAVQKITYNNHTYPLSTVIECVNGNEITTKDFNGNLWTFTDNSEDWYKGDICSLIMHDNYTDEVIIQIHNAKTESEISRIMRDARLAQEV